MAASIETGRPMNITLSDTDTRDVARELVRIREDRGIVATGRVLTLIVLAQHDDDLDTIIATARSVSREHPARVLILVTGEREAENRLDVELLLGGDAGAAEIVVMHMDGQLGEHPASIVTPLLLPDTPVVSWWPFRAPKVPSASMIGELSQRRITDARQGEPLHTIFTRRSSYAPGDSDLAWSRLTAWRGVLASTLDRPPFENITEACVEGSVDPSVDLAAGWLADRLGCPVTRVIEDADDDSPATVLKVTLFRGTADVVLEVLDSTSALVTIGDRPPFPVALFQRSTTECLAEELRHLDPDIAYARALRGLGRVRRVERNS